MYTLKYRPTEEYLEKIEVLLIKFGLSKLGELCNILWTAFEAVKEYETKGARVGLAKEQSAVIKHFPPAYKPPEGPLGNKEFKFQVPDKSFKQVEELMRLYQCKELIPFFNFTVQAADELATGLEEGFVLIAEDNQTGKLTEIDMPNFQIIKSLSDQVDDGF